MPDAFRREIEVETLVFTGRDDSTFERTDFERAGRKFIAGYEIVELPGGHFVHRESSDAFIDRLLRFLGPASATG